MTDTSRSRCDKLMAAARYIYIYTCFAILEVYLCDREEKKKENKRKKKEKEKPLVVPSSWAAGSAKS